MQRHGSKYFAHFPQPYGWVKIQPFQNILMLHIKLNGIRNAALCKHKFYPYTPTTPGVRPKVKVFFSESSIIAYLFKRGWSIEHHARTFSVLTHTLKL